MRIWENSEEFRLVFSNLSARDFMDFADRDKIQDYGDNLPFHPHSELYRSLVLPESIPRVGREPKKAFLMNLEEDTELWYQKTSISGQIRWERGIAYYRSFWLEFDYYP